MATYPAVYRAKSVKYEAPVLTAYVPQVFGDVPIEITDVIGSTTQGMGWVFFQGGDPDFPVWNGGGGGSVSDVVWTGPDAPTDRSIELWWDTDEPPSGGGTEEVYIGAEPPGAGYELWYDTDADAPLTIDQRWNTAWGTIAVGTLNPMSGTTITAATNISSPLTVMLLAGRRYEFEACVHATAGGTGANGFNLRFTGLAANDTWNAVTPNTYGQGRILTPVVGTGAVVTVTLQGYVEAVGKPVTLYTAGSAASFFVCRDVGPTTLVPAPPPPDWTMYDARYVNVEEIAPAWIPLTLTTAWTQRPSCELVRYRKVQDIVMVRGIVNFAAGGANPLATLPVGYQPALAVRQGTTWHRTSDGASLPLGIEVFANGTINALGLSSAGYHDINLEFPV